MIQSGGVLVKSRLWTPLDWNGIPQPGITQAFRWGSYDAIYRTHLWPAVLVNKIANAAARLPLKVYERSADDGRNEAPDHPYAQLLRRPHPTMDPFSFWLHVVSTLNVYGECFLLKERGQGGVGLTKWLHPVHPTAWKYDDGTWSYTVAGVEYTVRRQNFVHFKFFDPNDPMRGMSPLEPLRWTLENEEGARRANSAMWRNGARPSVVLKHPGNISDQAQQRLKRSWEDVHSGADNFAKTAVLEEGMEAQILSLSAEDMAYTATRQLNREEACAAFDVPPPVVHILDRATFSNIVEQMRSMYRDTMAPKLKLIESTLEMELRDGRMGRDTDPDYSDDVYAEFLMDEVLRGSFEARATAYQQADYMTIAEKRALENLPHIDGTDRLFINAANQPLATEAEGVTPQEIALMLQKIYLSVGVVISAEEARALLNSAGANFGELPQLGEGSPAPAIPDDPTVRRHLVALQKRMAELEGATDG